MFWLRRKNELAADLVRFKALDGMGTQTLRRLAGLINVREYATDETVFYESHPSAAVYFVRSGSIGLFRPHPNRAPDRIRYIGPGGIAGERALLDGGPRTWRAVALEPSILFALLRDDCLRLAQRSPQTAFALVQRISSHLLDELEGLQGEFYDLNRELARGRVRS